MGCLLSDGEKPSRIRQILGSVIAIMIFMIGMGLICWHSTKNVKPNFEKVGHHGH